MAATPSGRVPPSGLGMLTPPRWNRPVRSRVHALVQVGQPAFQPLPVHTPRHAIGPGCRTPLQLEERPAQSFDRDVVQKRGETLPWFPLYVLPYPVSRLCHAFPVLRPARALTFQIPPWARSFAPSTPPERMFLCSPTSQATIPESDFCMPFISGYGLLLSSAVPSRLLGRHADLPGPGAAHTNMPGFLDTAGFRPTSPYRLDECCLRPKGRPRHPGR